jgi:hypothetical protein
VVELVKKDKKKDKEEGPVNVKVRKWTIKL